jgi:ABC-type transport system involved in multi-copper enzyme maturation permease subunit
MLRDYFLKELREHLLDIRFPLIFATIVGLMSVSGLFFLKKYGRRQSEYQRCAFENESILRENSGRLVNLLETHQTLMMPPDVMRFVSDGEEAGLPNSARVSILELRPIENTGSVNPFMMEPDGLDNVFIFQVVFSFMAVLLTFNAVCGEKEKGTLRLTLSNSVPRDRILVGKFLSIITVLALPMVIGLTVQLLLLLFSPSVTLSLSQILQVLLIQMISLFYVAIFVFLGLFVSSMAAQSRVSLVLLLLVWVVFVIVIPYYGAGFFLSKTTGFPAEAEIEREVRQVRDAVWDRYPDAYRMNYESGDPRNVHNVRVGMEAHEAGEKIKEAYREKKIRSVERVRQWLQLSPAVTYQNVSESVSGTGLTRVKYFLERAKVYQQDLGRFFQTRDSRDPNSQHLYYHPDYVSREPFSPELVPVFRLDPVPLGMGLRGALYGILILILYNIIFFSAAYVAFLRYDVR